METTLPWSWYVDPEILRREQERIFRSAWQYAGHLGQLPEPGTFFTGRAGRLPVVVTRARDGELRAFLNVCRHRGFPLADGEGRRETLQCPYHAWTYGLDGSLRAAPRSDEEPDFPKEELGLCAIAVGTWGPFVFVNAGPRAGGRSRSPTLSARCRRRSPSSGSTSTRCATTSAGRPRWRRTGRSSARTSSSATTARSRIPASPR